MFRWKANTTTYRELPSSTAAVVESHQTERFFKTVVNICGLTEVYGEKTRDKTTDFRGTITSGYNGANIIIIMRRRRLSRQTLRLDVTVRSLFSCRLARLV